MRTGADEARSPKYIHVEREGRWLVDADRFPTLPAAWVTIEDRYLIGTRFRLRRMTDPASGAVALKLAKKYEAEDPTARLMVNAYLSMAEYAKFSALPALPIRKRRFEVDGFGVDLFGGALAGLVLAEVDAADAATLHSMVAPAWTVREASHDACFQGGTLAQLDASGLHALRSELIRSDR